ncbi:MAG: HlyD family secretion protein, partial [Candidatus Omnitrophica bacterium]|nr:HlyD family secretion protein [Candidatus Omnitrophota bacterium]
LKILKVTTENKEKYLVYLKKRLKEIERQIELQKRSVVKAPSEGVIWSILTKNGEHVDLGDELFQIVNPDEIWVDAFFSERYAAKLKPGQRMMVQLLGTDEQWDGEVVFVRGGSGRVTYNAAVEMPPILMSRRLVSVRLKVNWRDYFKDSEFFGVGRSMTVKLNREGPVNSFINKFLDY